jgi:hypothetical protein
MSTQDTFCTTPIHRSYTEYQVRAINSDGMESFRSEPVVLTPHNTILVVDASAMGLPLQTEFQGYTNKGYVRLEKDDRQKVVLKVDIASTGLYKINVRYANGNGRLNTDNKCAIRTLSHNGVQLGTLVMPQRGTGQWSDWGYSNALFTELKQGSHRFEIAYTSFNQNMNSIENTALLDQFRIILIHTR